MNMSELVSKQKWHSIVKTLKCNPGTEIREILRYFWMDGQVSKTSFITYVLYYAADVLFEWYCMCQSQTACLQECAA